MKQSSQTVRSNWIVKTISFILASLLLVSQHHLACVSAKGHHSSAKRRLSDSAGGSRSKSNIFNSKYRGSSNKMSVYETCLTQVTDAAFSVDNETTSVSGNAVLLCVANSLEETSVQANADLIEWLLILCGTLVFFMQVGFAMLCGGCVRKKNLQNTMLKNLLDVCGSALAFYSVGYAFAFGSSEDANSISGATFIGKHNFFCIGDNVNPAFWFFEFAFCATAATIVAGTLAERCQMIAYLGYSVFLSGFVYPVVAHALWSEQGFLSPFLLSNGDPFNNIGTIDFAGGAVVHLTGGTTALVAAFILGARRGRFYDSRGRPLATPKPFPGHSIALQLMGTMVLWFGWYGFNCGSALLLTTTPTTGSIAALVAVNSSLAGAAGAVGAMFTNMFIKERKTGEYHFDLTMAMNGSLAGLVAITSGCATFEFWASVCVGLVAGWAYMLGSHVLIKLKIDDAVDAVPVHLCGGVWAMISVGLFSSPARLEAAYGNAAHAGIFYEMARGNFDANLLANQIVGLLFVLGWTIGIMTPFFVFLNYMGWFRSDSLEEMVGLDVSYNMSGPPTDDTNNGEDDEVTSDDMRQALEEKRKKGKGGRLFGKKKNTTTSDDDDDDFEEGGKQQQQRNDDSSWNSTL